MEANMLRQQLVTLLNSMFQEGFLDEQFTQLQMLQDASNPSFVADVISLFSEDSERLLVELTKALEHDPIDFKKVDAYVHQFKGSSSSIGAHRVKVVCVDFRACCEEGNQEGDFHRYSQGNFISSWPIRVVEISCHLLSLLIGNFELNPVNKVLLRGVGKLYNKSSKNSI